MTGGSERPPGAEAWTRSYSFGGQTRTRQAVASQAGAPAAGRRRSGWGTLAGKRGLGISARQAMPACRLRVWGPWRFLEAAGSSRRVHLPRTAQFGSPAQRRHNVLMVSWAGQGLASEEEGREVQACQLGPLGPPGGEQKFWWATKRMGSDSKIEQLVLCRQGLGATGMGGEGPVREQRGRAGNTCSHTHVHARHTHRCARVHTHTHSDTYTHALSHWHPCTCTRMHTHTAEANTQGGAVHGVSGGGTAPSLGRASRIAHGCRVIMCSPTCWSFCSEV